MTCLLRTTHCIKEYISFFFCLINLQIQDIPHTVCISISLSLLTSVLLQLDYMNSATHSITEMYPRMRILPNLAKCMPLLTGPEEDYSTSCGGWSGWFWTEHHNITTSSVSFGCVALILSKTITVANSSVRQ